MRAGKLVLMLSDRYLVEGQLPMHALLATGAVHHRLVEKGLRSKCNLLIETGTAREAHHLRPLRPTPPPAATERHPPERWDS